MKRILFPIIITLMVVLGGCNVNNPDQSKKTYFTLWNDFKTIYGYGVEKTDFVFE